MNFFIKSIEYNKDILSIICQYLDDKSFRHLTMTCTLLFSFRELKQLDDIYAELALASRWYIKNIKVYDDRQLEVLIKLYKNKYNRIVNMDITAMTLINIQLPIKISELSISTPWRKSLNGGDFPCEKFIKMINTCEQLNLIKVNIYSIAKHSINIDRRNPEKTYENDIRYWIVQ